MSTPVKETATTIRPSRNEAGRYHPSGLDGVYRQAAHEQPRQDGGRRQRHDMANHLRTLAALDESAARAYLQELMQSQG